MGQLVGALDSNFFQISFIFLIVETILGAKVQIMANKNCKSYIIRTKRCLFAQKVVILQTY